MSESPTAWIDDLLDVPKQFQNGLVVGDGVSYDRYARQEFRRGDKGYVMSRGDLCDFDTCPKRWVAGYGDDDTKATEWGRLMDCMLLDGEQFGSRYAVAPATYTVVNGKDKGQHKPWNRNATVCDEWEQEQTKAGREVLKQRKFEDAKDANNILVHDEEIAECLHESRRQVMVIGEWVDADTGIVVPLKGLVDIVPSGKYADSLADFKTCNSAHPRSWESAVFEHNYHTQASLYLDLWNAATGEKRNEFRHILQESYKPWQVAKRLLSAEFISLGRERYQRILKRYAKALKDGYWADYDEPGPHDLAPDGWLTVHPKDWMVLQ